MILFICVMDIKFCEVDRVGCLLRFGRVFKVRLDFVGFLFCVMGFYGWIYFRFVFFICFFSGFS